VESGKTYLLRIINAGLANDLFFGVAGHRLTVVGTDARYTKPFTVDHIFISPGQTVDALLEADRATNGSSNGRYYMAARTFASNTDIRFNNSTATAILEYTDARAGTPDFPILLPAINDLNASLEYTAMLRSLGSKGHPVDVPTHVDEHMLITLAVNVLPCETGNGTCEGPESHRLAASLNNISFHLPSVDILDAYYGVVRGVYEADFPDKPPFVFNYTDGISNLPTERWFTKRGTKVKVLEYGAVVEVVFQDTAILGAENHPMHLHGFAFYVVGRGIGNFNETTDPAAYNLIDPPFQNTVTVPKAGWAAIRFRAANPGELFLAFGKYYIRSEIKALLGMQSVSKYILALFFKRVTWKCLVTLWLLCLIGVWFMHCHFERHSEWGMDTVFIVKDGKALQSKMMRRPPGMPRC
jgi:laccase